MAGLVQDVETSIHEVSDPLVLLVVDINGRELHDLVEVKDKEDRENGEFEHESGKSTHGDDKAPHRDRVADKAEFGVTACSEDTGDNVAVDRAPYHVVNAHHEHPEKVVFGLIGQVDCTDDER